LGAESLEQESPVLRVVLFMAYRSLEEVLAGSTPASIRRPSHTVITQFPP
jgi:hypothetical protein